jgi:L-lysine exporter family protein LysE/ArgO
MSQFLSGFALGFSLILAIGAQNAFVLKQGLKKEFVLWICLVCAVSDALLIAAGVAGFGAVVTEFPQIEVYARYGGAAFLIIYALLSFKAAVYSRDVMDPAGHHNASLLKALFTCLAFTWLNPHVYLDTVVLLGSISTQYSPNEWRFAAGAVSASFVFFFSLGYGARLLAPLFHQPMSWRILEAFVGVVMLSIAFSLIL